MLHTLLHAPFKTISRYLRGTLFAFVLSTTCIYTGMPGFAGFPDLSPEEMQALERELEQTAQAIEQYVSTLSPEQQAEFYQAVEEADRMMRSMSEEEFAQFFEEVLAQELANQPTPAQPTQITPPKVESVAEVVKPKVTSTEQEAALAIIDTIIQQTDEFIIKTNNIPDLSMRVKRWIDTHKVQISSLNTWDAIKNTIETFKQKLYGLKDVDPKTNQYRFISAFTKNNALYDMLNNLATQLSTQQPLITVSSFGIEALNTQSKRAIVSMLNAYISTIDAATAEIAAIFGEYVPEAQKIKEAEAKLKEQAEAEAAKPRTPKPPRVGGSRESESMPSYRPSSGYDGYGYDYGYGEPSRTSSRGTKEKPAKAKKSKDGRSEGTPQTHGPRIARDEHDHEYDKYPRKEELTSLHPATAKDGIPGVPTQGKATEKDAVLAKEKPSIACPINVESVSGILELIKSNLGHITDLLNETPKATSLESELTAQTEPNMQLALVTLPGLERRIKRLNELVKQYLDAYADSDEAKQQLRDLLDTNVLFASVAPQLKTLNEKLEADDALLEKISAAKQYAYLAIIPDDLSEIEQKAIDTLKKNVPHPSSLLTINDLLEAINMLLFIPQEEPAEEIATPIESEESAEESNEPFDIEKIIESMPSLEEEFEGFGKAESE